MTERRSKIIFWGIVTLAVLIWFQWERVIYYRFDSQTWQSAKPERRYFMARYLIEKGGIRNWTRDQVLEQLGQPKEKGSGFAWFYPKNGNGEAQKRGAPSRQGIRSQWVITQTVHRGAMGFRSI